MSTRVEKLKKLAEKKREINDEIDRLRAEEAQVERKHDARRKILVGSLVLAMVERGEWPRERLLEKLDGYLTRDHDRALFDLAPAQPAPPAAPGRAGR